VSEVQRLRSQRDAYLAKMKVVAESHVKFIDSAERDFVAEDRAGADGFERAPERVQRSVPESAAPAAASPRPANLFETSAAAAPAGEAIPGLGEILDRLSQGQRGARRTRMIDLPPLAPSTPPARRSRQRPRVRPSGTWTSSAAICRILRPAGLATPKAASILAGSSPRPPAVSVARASPRL
jgi:hypothetical protein